MLSVIWCAWCLKPIEEEPTRLHANERLASVPHQVAELWKRTPGAVRQAAACGMWARKVFSLTRVPL